MCVVGLHLNFGGAEFGVRVPAEEDGSAFDTNLGSAQVAVRHLVHVSGMQCLPQRVDQFGGFFLARLVLDGDGKGDATRTRARVHLPPAIEYRDCDGLGTGQTDVGERDTHERSVFDGATK